MISATLDGMSNKKKELKKEYRLSHIPMGVYQIRNNVNEKVFVGTAINLPGILNSHKFQLNNGSHPNKTLQAEWREFGSENFAFEILDELAPTGVSDQEYRADLAFLEEFWLDKLQPFGERGYNEKKKEREEKLKTIAQNKLPSQ